MANEHDIWQWQEPGTAWKGVGIYHVTLTIPSREPQLGELIIPENDPQKAYIQRTKLGNALVEKLLKHPTYYPEIKIVQIADICGQFLTGGLDFFERRFFPPIMFFLKRGE